jgi:hypothetical protein
MMVDDARASTNHATLNHHPDVLSLAGRCQKSLQASELDAVKSALLVAERSVTVVVRGFQPGDPCPDLLTEEEAIRYLRLDTIDIKNPADTLRRYREMNMLRGTQISKKVFYRRSELDQLITNLTNANPR